MPVVEAKHDLAGKLADERNIPIRPAGNTAGSWPVFSPNGLTARLRKAVSLPTHRGVRPRARSAAPSAVNERPSVTST